MAYLNSENILVFPSTKRGSKQVSARLLSEATLTSIVNKFLDTDGFVITSEDEYGLDNPFEFNIHGYYFRVATTREIINSLANSTLAIYANIILKEEGNYLQLQGQDDETVDPNTSIVTSSIYKGINFSDNGPIVSGDGTVYSLLILQRDSTNSEWYVPADSRYKFTKESLDIEIDGGII